MTKLPDADSKILQLSPKEPTLLFALQDLIITGGIDFDKWWDDYKVNFASTKAKKSKNQVDEWKKPKYVDIKSFGNSNESGVRTIDFYPDADDENTKYRLHGSNRDLIHHITAIGYQQSSGNNRISGKNSLPDLKGFPAIELLFVAENGKTGLKIIRCKGFTENEKIAKMNLAKLLKPADILNWCKKIKSIFGDTNYKWSKGEECLSYYGQIARLQGLAGYAFVRNEKDGIDLFTAMLKIFDTTPDKDGFSYSGKTNKTLYKTQKTTKVLNKSVKLDSERPAVDCYFYSAQLRLPLLKKPIPLVKKNVILYKG